MRCPRCGNENPEENRFCGQCGTTLLAPAPIPQKPQAVGAGQAQVVASPESPPRDPEPIRKAVPAARPDESASISGPSFLGLNDPAPSRVSPSKRATLSIDPHNAPPASNLHYLLEDEEELRGSGLWKFALILIALALAIGFGYLRWKNQGLAWLTPQAKKPALTDQPVTGDGNSASTNGSPAATQTPASTSITPEQQPAAPQNTAPPSNAVGGDAAGHPQTAAQTGATSAPANSPDGAKPADGGNAAGAEKSSATPAAGGSDTGSPDSTKESASADAGNDDSDVAPAKPKAEAPAKPRAAVPVDPVSEARKYIYGKGASQDCDHGLRLLKPAANSGNAKAMVEMGALYSAGLCTPRDLPTSYRWFAMALHKEPDNQSVQTDLQKLWGEMTQPERQLAIKLSQ